DLKRPLPATLIFDYPTTVAISGFLLQNVTLDNAETETAEVETKVEANPSLLDDLESLSDDDVDKLFAEMGLSENLTDE
ncbi:MAG: hypothetical protein IAF02_20895, partial [Anaerolineae bacterium]|nr:hypothetical protein [Anaerolineae bacterium]